MENARNTTESTPKTKGRGRPKGPDKYLTEKEKLFLLCFLSSHRSRAEKGLETANLAMGTSPTSVQVQGMAARFASMLSLIDDMASWLDGKQEWLPDYKVLAAKMETPECPPQT